jgi:hypothetical protein
MFQSFQRRVGYSNRKAWMPRMDDQHSCETGVRASPCPEQTSIASPRLTSTRVRLIGSASRHRGNVCGHVGNAYRNSGSLIGHEGNASRHSGSASRHCGRHHCHDDPKRHDRPQRSPLRSECTLCQAGARRRSGSRGLRLDYQFIVAGIVVTTPGLEFLPRGCRYRATALPVVHGAASPSTRARHGVSSTHEARPPDDDDA